MATGVIAGVGTIFQRYNLDTAEWENIAGIAAIVGPSAKRDNIDVTTFETEAGYRESIGGFKDGDTIALAMNLTREMFELLLNDFQDETPQIYKIIFDDEYNSEISFYGLVSTLPLSIPADDKIVTDVNIRITGELTLEGLWDGPFSSDAFLILDGTIIESGGNYYFEDQSSGGRNFLITGYDFDDAWDEGFPYKSDATISAPIGDTEFIGADVNNFFYAVDGTPNNIPVTAFFQNVDFENRLFCKHVAQEVDSDGLETYEPRVLEIVLYESAMSGDDLTTCESYYDVPEKITGALWVAKTGNDSTGDGSESNPYLTIVKAYTVSAVNQQIYVKTGVYAEYVYNLYHSNIDSIGNVVYESTNTGYGVRLRYNDVDTFSRFNMTPEAIATASCYLVTTDIIEVESIVVDSNAGNTILGSFKTLKNCIFKGTNSSHCINNTTGVQEKTIDTNLFKTGTTTAVYNPNSLGKLVIKNNKFRLATGRILWNLNAVNGVDFIGNDVEVTVPGAYYINSEGDLALLQILYNTFKIAKGASNPLHILNHVTNCPIVKGNIFDIEDDVDNIITYFLDSQCDVENNIYTLEGEIATNAEILALISGAGVSGQLKAINNRIESKRIGGYNIGFGSEGSNVGENTISDVEISRNYIKGRHAYPSPSTNAVHALFVGFQKNAVIKYNHTKGAGYATVVKGDVDTIYNSGGVYYNIHNEFKRGVYCKGVSGVSIYNNTFFSNAILPDYAIRIGENASDEESSSCKVKNNIFVYLGTGTYNAIEIRNEGVDNESDYNLFYCPNGTLKFTNSSGERTWAEWVADGYDTHSHILTDEEFSALFKDYPNDDFSINVMPYYGADVSTSSGDEDYEIGLDATTNWGDVNTIPNVVTKEQDSNWSIGAYIY